MDNTRAQQKALDDELESTLQVALDALKLTPFYKTFEISADVPEIYMQEFWRYAKICPKVPSQIFEEPPLKEDILSFIRDLGHTGEIKFLSDVNVNHMHQPCRPFSAIINKCLSGKTTALESLRLSRAQILWGMYHNKTVDYVYLLWEDLVYQVENKKSKKNNDMDDFMFTTIRVISKHHDTQVYGVILPQHLTNQAMVESEAYKTYLAYATGEKIPKLKYVKNKADSESSPKKKTAITSKGSKVKSSSKKTKSDKKKQPATQPKSKGLNVLSEAALSEADQIKLATKRSKKEFYSSYASGSGERVDIQSKVPDEQQQIVSGTNEGAGDKPEVLDVPEYRSESKEEPWTFSQREDDAENDEHDSEDGNDEHDSENNNDDEDDDQENVSGETKSDDDGDDFVHPNLSTYKADDQEEEKEKEKDQEDDDNVMGGEQEDEEDEEVYGDLNLNLDKRDAEMTDAQINQETEEDIDSILNPNVQSDIPVNVSVFATTETPSSDTIIPQPPILIIQSHQQTHDSTTTTTIPTITLPEIPNFASLFSFERRVSSLETELSELKQTNQFAKALSSILGIVDNYLASKMKDAVNVAVQLQSNKLREETQAENDCGV
ncbi:hypothetical protein Tco_0921434 [Tanacetum coccineum]